MATKAPSAIRAALRYPSWMIASLRGDTNLLSGAAFQPWLLQQSRSKRKLSVVLISHVEPLGRPGEVIQVAPGYARNMLLPQKLALPAIDKYLKQVEAERKNQLVEVVEQTEPTKTEERVISDDDVFKEAEEIARRLDTVRLNIRCNTPHKSSEVRQPVTAASIVSEVRRQLGIEMAEGNLKLAAELTTIGDYELPLRFPKGVKLPGEKEEIRLKLRLRRN